MNLHVAVSGWLLGEPSGANRRLLALLEHLPPLLAADERVTVLHRPDYAPPPLPGIGWRPIAIAAGPSWLRACGERRQLPGCLRELGATVLDHGFLPLPRVAVPVCLTLHDLRAAEGLTRWPRSIARWVLRRDAARASAVVVPSRFTAERLRHFAPGAEPALVVGNGVTVPAELPPPPAPGPRYLLHVGHVERRKNLAVVVRALARLVASHRPELRLAGRDAGDLRHLQQLAARLGVAASLRTLGVVADAALPALYAGASAVVVPSRYEGFGLPALDGLAHGRPVLVAAAGALPEVVGDQGQVLPPDDDAAWARAIEALDREAVGGDDAVRQHRRQRAATFGWSAAAGTLLAAWRRIAASPRAQALVAPT